MIKHIYPKQGPNNGVAAYGKVIDPLLPQLSNDILHFELGYGGWQELWQAYRNLKSPHPIPYALTLHDPPVVVGKPFSRWLGSSFIGKLVRKPLDLTLGRALIRKVVQGAWAVIVLNPLAKPVVAQIFTIPADQIFIGPLPPLLTRPSRPADETQTILFFGNLSRRKGVHLLLEAFLALNRPDWQLVIAGSAQNEDRYRSQLIARAGNDKRIRFSGFITDAELAKLLSQSAIVVLPYEDPGIIHASAPAVNAMGFGKPVIASNIPIFSGLVTSQTGRLFRESDSGDLSAKLAELMDDPALREKLGKAAQAIIDVDHSPAAVRKSLEEIYKAL